MSDRIFRIDFYPQDWLTQTSKMTPEERGVFIQICAMIYASGGAIENDQAWIGRASNCSPRKARAIIDALISMDALQVSGSKITQKRCESELKAKRTHLEQCAKGGRKSAEIKSETKEINNITSSEASIPLGSTLPLPSLNPKEVSKSVPLTPTPEPYQPPKKDDDEISEIQKQAMTSAAVQIIQAFDDERAKVWGEPLRRPWPTSNDLPEAQRLVADGIPLDFCKAHYAEKMGRSNATGGKLPGSLKWFDQSLREAWAARPPEKMTDGDKEISKWRGRVAIMKKFETPWRVAEWGAPPGSPNCQCPAIVLQEHGLVA